MKKWMIGSTTVVLFITFLVTTVPVAQTVPGLITYQGRLTDNGGQPLDSNTVPMHFTLLDGDTPGANVLWGETQSAVKVDRGIYNTMLGSVNPIPGSALSGPIVYLEVSARGEILTPRQRLTSVAFALKAGDASTLGGNPPAGYYSKAEVDALLSTMQSQIDALQSQAAANTADISTHDGVIAAHDTAIAATEAAVIDHDLRLDTVETKLAPVSVANNDFIFTGVNVNIRSGSGSTSGAVNGKGNLIVGYNENSGDNRTGSHNLVVGPYHTYSSYGGLLAGYNNSVSNVHSTVSGGSNNVASGEYASITGGTSNTATVQSATVAGGYLNQASGQYSTVSGGYHNAAAGAQSSVSGGQYNSAGGTNASVSGGYANGATGADSNVSGGSRNTASGDRSSVAGGGGANISDGNQAFAHYSAIIGGSSNIAGDPALTDHSLATQSTISGGGGNTASGANSSICGGALNRTSNYYSTVSGGSNNTASGQSASVSGGQFNTASGQNSSITGGRENTATVLQATVAGGYLNQASGQSSTVSGGYHNAAAGAQSSVSGGQYNSTTGANASVSGGYANGATGADSSISGGARNQAGGERSFIAGGGGANINDGNVAFANYSAILGGGKNLTGDQGLIDHTVGLQSTISGGYNNMAAGLYSAVSGGANHSVAGQYNWQGGQTFWPN